MENEEEGNELVGLVRDLVAALGTLQLEVAAENQKRDRRINLSQIAIVAAMMVAILATFVGFGAIRSVQITNHNRNAGRLAACVNYNIQQRQLIDGQIQEVATFAAAIPGDHTMLLAHEAEVIKEAYKFRDCTPAGIALYLQNTVPSRTP